MSGQQARAGNMRAAGRPLTIAVASGKGGTGKTTVSTNLAETAAVSGMRVHLLDTDVEEPNCHIFVSPRVESRRAVTTQVPAVDEAACIGCGACAQICQYSAIAMAGSVPIIFADLCHSCTGCALVCPTGAITLHDREIGMLERGRGGAAGFAFTEGSLNVGESVSSPVIHAVKAERGQAELTLIDAPPGTACPVVEATEGADYIILVTEPTPFGLNDLELAVEMVRKLGSPFGVVINRADVGDAGVRHYCRREGIRILAEIDDDRRVAEAYSRGELSVDAVPEFRLRYEELLTEVIDAAGAEGASGAGRAAAGGATAAQAGSGTPGSDAS
jgi:MinD superfamily P-loop ATPase